MCGCLVIMVDELYQPTVFLCGDISLFCFFNHHFYLPAVTVYRLPIRLPAKSASADLAGSLIGSGGSVTS